jgi:hypothetical protein
VRAAGGMGAQVFTREAVMLIHERSRGIPRSVSVIADNALITAFALRHKPVTTSIVNEVCRDLALEVSAEVAAPVEELPPLPQNTPAPPRVLALEHAQPHDAVSGTATSIADDDTPMFTSVFPKRRRFSLFSKSGSK